MQSPRQILLAHRPPNLALLHIHSQPNLPHLLLNNLPPFCNFFLTPHQCPVVEVPHRQGLLVQLRFQPRAAPRDPQRKQKRPQWVSLLDTHRRPKWQHFSVAKQLGRLAIAKPIPAFELWIRLRHLLEDGFPGDAVERVLHVDLQPHLPPVLPRLLHSQQGSLDPSFHSHPHLPHLEETRLRLRLHTPAKTFGHQAPEHLTHRNGPHATTFLLQGVERSTSKPRRHFLWCTPRCQQIDNLRQRHRKSAFRIARRDGQRVEQVLHPPSRGSWGGPSPK